MDDLQTITGLSPSDVEEQISKAEDCLEKYNTLYTTKRIKCLTLKRLIQVKESELRLLKTLRNG